MHSTAQTTLEDSNAHDKPDKMASYVLYGIFFSGVVVCSIYVNELIYLVKDRNILLEGIYLIGTWHRNFILLHFPL